MLGCTGGVKPSLILLHIMRSHIPHPPLRPHPASQISTICFIKHLRLFHCVSHFIVSEITWYTTWPLWHALGITSISLSTTTKLLPLQNCYCYKTVTATKLLPLQNCYRCYHLSSREPVRRTGFLLVFVITLNYTSNL